MAILVSFSHQFFSEERIAYLFIQQRDIKSKPRLASHPKSKRSRFVHSALGMKCENCRQVTSQDKKTSKALVVMGGASVRPRP
jgi:hypothetical protein